MTRAHDLTGAIAVFRFQSVTRYFVIMGRRNFRQPYCCIYAYFVAFLTTAALLSRGATALAGIQIGPATPDDLKAASRVLLKLKMNPIIGTEAAFLTAKKLDDNSLIGFGQIRPLDDDHAELASVYVQKEFRRQGVATDLISALIERHEAAKPMSNLCVLTLEPTTRLYEQFGFTIVPKAELSSLPVALQLEFKAGKAISLLLGNSLVCMIRPSQTGGS